MVSPAFSTLMYALSSTPSKSGHRLQSLWSGQRSMSDNQAVPNIFGEQLEDKRDDGLKQSGFVLRRLARKDHHTESRSPLV